MTDTIIAWFLHSIDASTAPKSLTELAQRFDSKKIDSVTLFHETKWEPILRGEDRSLPNGWVQLGSLAATRRGIATGSNEFFLISRETVKEYQISDSHLVSCVGRAKDVPSIIFSKIDYENALRSGARCILLDIKGDLSEADKSYIALGEAKGFHKRYITTHREPWYSMEQRDVAPIWASVFGRGDLEFVFNAAKVKSLTNFHCVTPVDKRDIFAQALTVTLNASITRSRSKFHARGFGGGLAKFEPNDLKSISVPDLRHVDEGILKALAAQLFQLDAAHRSNVGISSVQGKISE